MPLSVRGVDSQFHPCSLLLTPIDNFSRICDTSTFIKVGAGYICIVGSRKIPFLQRPIYFTWRFDHVLFSISSVGVESWLSLHQTSLIVFSSALGFLSWPLSFWLSLHRLSKSEIEVTLDKGTIILWKHAEVAAGPDLLRLRVWQVSALDERPLDFFWDRIGLLPRVFLRLRT